MEKGNRVTGTAPVLAAGADEIKIDGGLAAADRAAAHRHGDQHAAAARGRSRVLILVAIATAEGRPGINRCEHILQRLRGDDPHLELLCLLLLQRLEHAVEGGAFAQQQTHHSVEVSRCLQLQAGCIAKHDASVRLPSFQACRSVRGPAQQVEHLPLLCQDYCRKSHTTLHLLECQLRRNKSRGRRSGEAARIESLALLQVGRQGLREAKNLVHDAADQPRSAAAAEQHGDGRLDGAATCRSVVAAAKTEKHQIVSSLQSLPGSLTREKSQPALSSQSAEHVVEGKPLPPQNRISLRTCRAVGEIVLLCFGGGNESRDRAGVALRAAREEAFAGYGVPVAGFSPHYVHHPALRIYPNWVVVVRL